MKPEQLVAQLRTHLGTPWKHQGRLKGVGLDCAGLIVVAARECGLELVDDTAYGRRPDAGVLLRTMLANGLRIVNPHELAPGDVLVMRFDSNPQHLAVVTEVPLGAAPRIIHAAANARKVVEHSLDASWRAKLAHSWRLKDFQ